MVDFLNSLTAIIPELPQYVVYGKITAVQGLMLEITGLDEYLSIGSRVEAIGYDQRRVLAEVVSFKQGKALALPFTNLEGIGLNCRVEARQSQAALFPDISWKGRVINALGEPVDGKGPLQKGTVPQYLRSPPPPAHSRRRLGEKLDLGVRALNCFIPCCFGQRLGIFAGSGVGKSVMMSMMARYGNADVTVVGLIGERGREVQEFLEDDLGEEGLANSVVVVATSDESPLMRRQAAYTTLTVAEFFRRQKMEVLCLMDSVTRFAMAQREIGLSGGEPPTTKGYPPTTFTELPKLLERAGPGNHNEGNITALFSVLVEGDDHNEPIADAVRGIVDGHIVLERQIAERGRYPAINILKSVSRSLPACHSPEEYALMKRARAYLSDYENMADLIRIGAYKMGSDQKIDEAIRFYQPLEEFLNQRKDDHSTAEEAFQILAEILGD
ncbi:MAG: flagellar protein export ATPase FliI [Alphaproteobacteria bacterium]